MAPGIPQGTVLKNWVIGKKLGSGACSDVYVVTPVKADKKFQNDSYAMKLSPLPVIVKKKGGPKRKKTEAERNADALYAEQLLYASAQLYHRGIPKVPMGCYGEDQGYRFFVLERLGRTLSDVIESGGPIPEKTAARLGIDMLDIFQFLHGQRVLFVDVKPENFMLGRDKENQIYVVDFGISERFIQAKGNHKPYNEGSIVGTPTYLSLNCHKGATPSRRDDLEAMLNVLVYCMRGNLPWQNAKSDADGASIKASTSIAKLCDSFSHYWTDLFKEVRAYEFEQQPNYSSLSKTLQKIAGKFSLSSEYNWNQKGSATPAHKRREVESELSVDEETSPIVKRSKKKSTATKKRAVRKPTPDTIELLSSSDEEEAPPQPVAAARRRRTAKKSPEILSSSDEEEAPPQPVAAARRRRTAKKSPEKPVSRSRYPRRTAASAAKAAADAADTARAAANRTSRPKRRRPPALDISEYLEDGEEVQHKRAFYGTLGIAAVLCFGLQYFS